MTHETLTSELFPTLVFIALGFVGQVAHYLKKRHWDNTTTLSLLEYAKSDVVATKQAVTSTIAATAALAFAHDPSAVYHLADLVAPLTAGYTLDSWLNKTTESKM